jgi:hypothetical protein
MSNLIKISPLETELFPVEGQTEGEKDGQRGRDTWRS